MTLNEKLDEILTNYRIGRYSHLETDSRGNTTHVEGLSQAKAAIIQAVGKLIDDFVSDLTSRDTVLNDKLLLHDILRYQEELRAKLTEGEK